MAEVTTEVDETEDSLEQTGSDDTNKRMVLVTGTGRSGTSTMAGTLETFGLHVPGPVRPPDNANPRGFFESKWVIDYHNRMLDRARAHTMDGDPHTALRTRKSVNQDTREQLNDFLSAAIENHDRLVIKDPRTVWFIPLWTRTAASLKMPVSFVTMLRHPAEAVGSRTVHWSVSENPERVRNRQIANLAGWINVSLLNERRTRGSRRVFVRYDDLLADWRSAMKGVSSRLKLDFDGDPIDQRPHPVDEFIDPGLKRVEVRWDELDVPRQLSDLAERVWQSLQHLVEPRSDAAKARKELEDQRLEYDAIYTDARAITLDATRAAIESVERRLDGSAAPVAVDEAAVEEPLAEAGSTP